MRISSQTKRRSAAFSLQEALIVIAVVGVIAAVAFIGAGNIKDGATRNKLENDIATINTAVGVYLANGGSLDGVTDPQEILNKLKTSRSSDSDATFAGFGSSMIDQRLAVRMIYSTAPVEEITLDTLTEEYSQIAESPVANLGGPVVLDETNQQLQNWEESTLPSTFNGGTSKTGEWAYRDVSHTGVEETKSQLVKFEPVKIEDSAPAVELSDSTELRAVWNASKSRFEVASTGNGVVEFYYDSAMAAQDYGTEERERSAIDLNAKDGWIWEYKDTVGTAPPGPTDIPVGDGGSPPPPPPANDAPVAVDDFLSTPYETTGSGDVLSNDYHPQGETLEVVSNTDPQYGTVVFKGGAFQYTPNKGYSGADSFSYTIRSTNGVDVGMVSIVVEPSASMIQAIDDAYTLDAYSRIGCKVWVWFFDDGVNAYINPLENDIIPEGSPKIVSVRKTTNNVPFTVQIMPDNRLELTSQHYVHPWGQTQPTPLEDAIEHKKRVKDSDGNILRNPPIIQEFWDIMNAEDRDKIHVIYNETLEYTVEDAIGQQDTAEITVTVDVLRRKSPIALDLDGDGKIGLTMRETRFDLDGDGEADSLRQWFAPGDGILVDKSDLSLFGDEGGRYADGYAKLALRDQDRDQQLQGDELKGLALWLDNGDAKFERSELRALVDFGIVSLDLRHENYVSTADTASGAQIRVEDVWLFAND